MVTGETGDIVRHNVGVYQPGMVYKWPNGATPLDDNGDVAKNLKGQPIEKPSIKLIPLDDRAMQLLCAAWGKERVKLAWPKGPVPLVQASVMVNPEPKKAKAKSWKGVGEPETTIPDSKISTEPLGGPGSKGEKRTADQ